MKHRIVRVDARNYGMFEDMVHWRQTGSERARGEGAPNERIQSELLDPNLYVYAAEAENRFVGWISLIYLPKVGKFKGFGHVYVDELWVAPAYRRRGLAEALMQMADMVAKERAATGVRLYVNAENPAALKLYQKCGFHDAGTAYFMEKEKV